jgi:indolepyruvate ferredoxin oxidoreductase beta subunit
VFGSVVRKDHVDLLVGLEPLEGLRQGVRFLSPEGTAIINTRPINPLDVSIGNADYPEINTIAISLQKICKEVIMVDGTSLAEEVGDMRTLNVVMLGIAVGLGKVPLSRETLERTILALVPSRTVEINRKAFQIGQNYTRTGAHS